MATQIKDTPVLKGKDAERFLEELYLKLKPPKKETREDLKRIEKNYQYLESIAEF